MKINSGQKLLKKAKTIIPGGNQLLSKRSEMFLPDLHSLVMTRPDLPVRAHRAVFEGFEKFLRQVALRRRHRIVQLVHFLLRDRVSPLECNSNKDM